MISYNHVRDLIGREIRVVRGIDEVVIERMVHFLIDDLVLQRIKNMS